LKKNFSKDVDMKSLLKEIGRKSILWSCLAIGLLTGGVLNLLAKVEQDCFVQFQYEGKECWGALYGCEECWGWVIEDLDGTYCDGFSYFCSGQ
jgi:aryl-alcohol dehydrogenase-like predicted oxidoreductase